MCIWHVLEKSLDDPRRRHLDLEGWIEGEAPMGPGGMSDGRLTSAPPEEPEQSERRAWAPLPPESIAMDTVCPGGIWSRRKKILI